jgi:phosphatidylglycerophosphatase A
MTQNQPENTENSSLEVGVTEQDSLSIEKRARAVAFGSVSGFLAFGFGSGLLTRAPGTMGTLAAVPVAVVLELLGLNGLLFLLVTFFLGVWVCNDVTLRLGVEDYGGIVWDEMVAYWLVVAFLPFHWGWYLAAFVIFRAFDILKPWPISLLEERIEGGLGIMLDDVLAAIYTLLILQFINTIIFNN